MTAADYNRIASQSKTAGEAIDRAIEMSGEPGIVTDGFLIAMIIALCEQIDALRTRLDEAGK